MTATEKKLVDIENNGYVRLGTALLVIVGGLSVAVMTGRYMERIDNRLTNIENNQMLLTDLVNQRTNDRWTFSDHKNWCKLAELANTDWKCVEVSEGRSR